MMLTDEEFRLFRNLIYEESGISFKETKRDYLENRLARRMRETNRTSPYWYYRYLTENRKAELLVLLDLLTVNETSFFRNRPQFELFRNVILPEMTARNEQAGKLRIWSAGCSTGEEPYSIAMTVLEALPDAGRWDVTVFASDLSLRALEVAHRAAYPASKTQETVPPHLLQRYFIREGGTYRVKEQVRDMVVFDFHNLKHESGLGGLDAVFCRNVMIYFDEDEQKRLARRLHGRLNPGGWLLLGHAETLYGWGLDFRFVSDRLGTAYRKPREEEKP